MLLYLLISYIYVSKHYSQFFYDVEVVRYDDYTESGGYIELLGTTKYLHCCMLGTLTSVAG